MVLGRAVGNVVDSIWKVFSLPMRHRRAGIGRSSQPSWMVSTLAIGGHVGKIAGMGTS
jgi:hypothetical protein